METLKTLAMMMKKPQYMNLSVVGSPTINNGVVSGFSIDDYLTMQSINSQDVDELVVKFKINSSGVTQNVNIPIFNSNAIKIQATTTSSTSGFYYTQFQIPAFSFVQARAYLTFDNWHWIKYTNDESMMRAYYSSDGITWTLGQEKSSVGMNTSGTTNIGNSNFETGEIDFNNSYIVKNGTKYIFTL